MAFVYSCCFWFSLRLGGILIGIFSLLQASLALMLCSWAHSRSQQIKDEMASLMNMKLIFTRDYLEVIENDPEKYITLGISLTCVYMVVCVLFIYGAYVCNNVLMVVYILVELVRLAALAAITATWLLVLKQNTMDIGLLIGASVACGFLLLGMFYLWVCAASLPVLVNEMERDAQAATIQKLQQLLERNPKTFAQGLDSIPLAGDRDEPRLRPRRPDVYTLPLNRGSNVNNKSFINGPRVSSRQPD